MTLTRAMALAAATLLVPAGAAAQSVSAEPARAAGSDISYSTDADGTEVITAGANLDFANGGPEDYRGFRLERVSYNPLGKGWSHDDRVYLRAADTTAGWAWTVQAGTDGRTALGAISAHDNAPFRKELFVERVLVETPTGVAGNLYATLVGASVDLPIDERSTLAVVAALQDFTGHNHRTHLRANFVHVLKPEWGLSAQLRTRWFRDSDPHELDYYSPRWYAQVLPVLQMRRTTESGWRWLVAGGIGAQRDSDSGWRRSSLLNAQVTGPRKTNGWAVTGAVLYSETPTASGAGYDFFQVSAGVVRAF